MNRTRALFVVGALLGTGPLRAERDGAAFLGIGVGTRAAGMGSAFTAAADDVTAAYWNPAGLARLDRREAGATHAEWIAGTSFDHAAYAHPAGMGTWAASVTHLSLGGLDGRDDDGARRGTFSAGDTAAGLSFARPLGGGSDGGLTLKWIEQRIADRRASGFAADAGLRRALGSSLTAAIAVRNAGPSLSLGEEKYSLPLTAAAGLLWRSRGGLSFSLDGERRVREGRWTARVGTEYRVWDRMALRAGYQGKKAGAAGGAGQGLHMGVGLRIGETRLDYALTPAGDYGDAQQVSLSFSMPRRFSLTNRRT